MSIGGVPPPIPPEVLDEERDKIRKQLEIERGKSRVLYEKAYQDYLRSVSRSSEQGPAQTPVSETDFYAQIRKAYGEAYALRAFRDVMEETTKPGHPAPQTMPSTDSVTTNLMKSGLPPQVVNEWLKTLEPEALGALVALSTQNPMLSPMLFAMSQRGGQQQLTTKDVIELFTALSKRDTPNVSLDIPKLIEAVKSQPQGTDPEKIVNATLTAIQTGMQMAMPKGGGEPKQRMGILETLIAQGPEGTKVAKELGLIGGEAPYLQIMAEMRRNDQQFQERMKSSDRAWELRLEELRLRSNLERAKISEGRRRTELIAGSLRRIGAAVARGLVEGVGPEGEGKKAEGEGEEAPEAPKEFQCQGEINGKPCGATISVPPEIKPGAIVTCAKCGAQYEAEASKK